MKESTKSILPTLSAPVSRSKIHAATSTSAQAVNAQELCDIITRQCTPFAGDSEE